MTEMRPTRPNRREAVKSSLACWCACVCSHVDCLGLDLHDAHFGPGLRERERERDRETERERERERERGRK